MTRAGAYRTRAKKVTPCEACGRDEVGVWVPPFSDKPQPPKITRHTNPTTGRQCDGTGRSVHPNVVFDRGPA